MIGFSITVIWVITLEEMRSREIIRVSQDRNIEWILFLATVCIVIMKILLVLIYKGKSGDL